MCDEIDTLFFQDRYLPTTSPPKVFTNFEALPAELRNNVYEQFLSAHFARTTIKINAHSETVFPSLLYASKRLRTETRGCHQAWLVRALRDSSVQISAKIRDYDFAPLRERLGALSREHCVAEADLVSRTRVEFVGKVSLPNIMDWVDRHLADPVANPAWNQEEGALVSFLDGYGDMDMFYGSMGVVSAVENFRRMRGDARWRRLAREFLGNARELGFGRWVDGCEDVEVLSNAVFEVIALWHHGLRMRMTEQEKDMAHVIYSFWRECGITFTPL